MIRVERNGLSGLLLRGLLIGLAVVVFGCAPKAPSGQADAAAAASPLPRVAPDLIKS